jgi:anti-sigma-K factor RskA
MVDMTTSPQWPDEETLLAYHAGRLDAAERRAIDEAAANDPALAAEIALMQGAREAFAGMETDRTPGEFGWKRLERAIATETAAPAPSAERNRRPYLQMAAAAAIAAVAGWQAQDLLRPSDPSQGYVPATQDGGEGPEAIVTFEPYATEAEIRAVLRAVGARVVDGPSAIGLWRLGFDSEAARDAGVVALNEVTGIVSSALAD